VIVPGPGQYSIPSMMDLLERKNKMFRGRGRIIQNQHEPDVEMNHNVDDDSMNEVFIKEAEN